MVLPLSRRTGRGLGTAAAMAEMTAPVFEDEVGLERGGRDRRSRRFYCVGSSLVWYYVRDWPIPSCLYCA